MTPMYPRIYLASKSPRRRDLLRQIGVQFDVLTFRDGERGEDADVDETPLPGEAPRERLIHARPVGTLGWQVVQFGDLGEARTAALGGGVAVAFATAFMLGLAGHFRHRARRRRCAGNRPRCAPPPAWAARPG